MPFSRIYIVTDPSLAAAVQRASKALSFTPLVPDVTKRVLGLDDATIDIVRQNLDPEPGDPRGFLADMHDMVYSYLGPGESLNELTLEAVRELAVQVNAYASSLSPASGSTTGEVVDLLEWLRHFVTIGTAHFLYGPHNPLAAHPELEAAFWDFDHGLGALLMNVVPSVTARRPYRGREALAAALVEYLEAGHARAGAGASRIVQNRVRIAEQYGWGPAATARSELSFLFAGIVNTATTTFWTVLRVFADPALLAVVRAELADAGALSSSSGSGSGTDAEDSTDTKTNTLSVDALKAGCPTLLAVFRECLRLGSDNYSTRLVKADTLLSNRYFLKGDSVVQIAGGVIHADERIWGADADAFNPSRFLSAASSGSGSGSGNGEAGGGGGGARQKESSSGNGIHPAAFRSFGGGKTLCPGRHFATNEILGFVAMVVATFELEAVDGGRITVPNKDDKVLPVHILEPKVSDAVKVRVKLRGGSYKALRVVS